MPSARRIALSGLVLCLLAAAPAAGDPASPEGSPPRIARWESDLSVGSVSSGRLGIVKSVWWYAVPKVVAVGLSLDHVLEAIPLSLNVALNAPLPVVVPFVCAGAGTTLTVGGITHYGGGIKIRLGRRLGVIGEYRRYHYWQTNGAFDPILTKAAAHYFGAGVAWIY
jgi:hypothetical protein